MLKILEHAQRITPLHEEMFEELRDIMLPPKAQS